MRVLIVTHYFPPEIGAPQARLSDLARFWSDAGEAVTVLTGMPNHPTGVVHPAYRRRLLMREAHDGYDVVRTWLYATPNEGIVRKTLGHVSFMITSLLLGTRRTGPADVVVVSSPTFFSIFSAWAIARLKRARFVVEVRDLWPAIFVELGVLTNEFVIRALTRLEMWAYRQADEVVVVSEGFRDDLLRRGVPAIKVHTIRNGVALDNFEQRMDRGEARQRIGVTDQRVVVLYLGAHGISHGLDNVVAAASHLQRDDVEFVFVGEGAAKRSLEKDVLKNGPDNVRFLPGIPRRDVPQMLAAADICLVPLRDVPLFSSFIPSKIFEYFAARKAVVGAVRGEPADILLGGGAEVVPPGDPELLAAAIDKVASDPGLRRSMGENGRAFVEKQFDRRVLAATYRDVLSRLVPGPTNR